MSRSVKPVLPQAVAFHAEIHVLKGEEVVTLCVDRPEWATEGEVLRDLAKEYGVRTVGELVGELEPLGCVRAEGSSPEGFCCRGDRGLHEVGEVIV